MKPLRIDNGIAIFSTRDIEDYGLPEEWGYENYQVVESRELNLVTDYKMERQYDMRPIHRYSRLERFKVTLRQLIGEHGVVPDHIVTVVGHYLSIQEETSDLWNRTRSILKTLKCRLYYNRIPFILKKLKYDQCIKWDAKEYLDIVERFKVISYTFDQEKKNFKRTYFPNLRFIALKLLEESGGQMIVPIPLARTVRKRNALEKLWQELKSMC